MSSIEWTIEHSTEAAAPSAFAWEYMTNVKNWDDPPAEFHLHGSFAAGSAGTTETPGQPPRQWRLREVNPYHSYTVEIGLEGAAVLCKWTFTALSGSHTILTQRISLEGQKAASYREDVERAFAAGIAPGMSRIATALGRAYASGSPHLV